MFIEERLLDTVAYGSQFGQEFKTRVKTLKSGADRRNADWSMPLGKYTVRYDLLEDADHALVAHAHMACMGRLIPFRFKNWADYKATDEAIGTGTGVSQIIQLLRNYTFGPVTLSRPIKKPVTETVVIKVAGVPSAAVVDYTTGKITITATSGAAITWSGEFDIPVRFESDRLDIDISATSHGGMLILNSDVGLIEDRLS